MSWIGPSGSEDVPGESAIALLARVLRRLSSEDGDALLVVMNNIRLAADRKARVETFKDVTMEMAARRDRCDRDAHVPFDRVVAYKEAAAWAKEQMKQPRCQVEVPETYVRAAIWLETKVRTLGGVSNGG